MKALDARRVLLCGPQWFGDLLGFCERGLHELGVQTRTVAVNGVAWQSVARRGAQLGRLPGGGPLERAFLRRAMPGTHDDFAHRLREAARDFKPDLVLCLLCWGYAPQAAALRELGAPVAGWLMDDPFGDTGSLARELAAFDALFCVDAAWEPGARLLARCDIHTLACGADLASHRPLNTENAVRRGLVFVGSSYAGKAAGIARAALLERIADLPLEIWGDAGWKANPRLKPRWTGRGLSSDAANAVYNGAAGALNIHHPQWKRGTSLRTFALCASGAPQLVDWRPDLEQYFVPGEEVAVFRNSDELRAQSERLLRDTTWREQLARNGLARVRRDHTYAQRLRTILDRCL